MREVTFVRQARGCTIYFPDDATVVDLEWVSPERAFQLLRDNISIEEAVRRLHEEEQRLRSSVPSSPEYRSFWTDYT